MNNLRPEYQESLNFHKFNYFITVVCNFIYFCATVCLSSCFLSGLYPAIDKLIINNQVLLCHFVFIAVYQDYIYYENVTKDLRLPLCFRQHPDTRCMSICTYSIFQLKFYHLE